MNPPLIMLVAMFLMLCTCSTLTCSSNSPSHSITITPLITPSGSSTSRVVVNNSTMGGINMTCSSGYQALFSVCQNASYIHDTSLHLCCDQLSTSFSTIPDCYCQFTHEGLIMNGTAFYSDAVNLCGLSVPPSITACLLNTNGTTNETADSPSPSTIFPSPFIPFSIFSAPPAPISSPQLPSTRETSNILSSRVTNDALKSTPTLMFLPLVVHIFI